MKIKKQPVGDKEMKNDST